MAEVIADDRIVHELRDAVDVVDGLSSIPVRGQSMKTFWLSFCDKERPKGEQFLGACIVDVTDQDAAEAAIDVALGFPNARPGAEWVAAALKKAWRLGCNPGGEVAHHEIPADNPNVTQFQRGVLLDRATIEEIDRRINASTNDE